MPDAPDADVLGVRVVVVLTSEIADWDRLLRSTQVELLLRDDPPSLLKHIRVELPKPPPMRWLP
jgi:hypothetical protein